MAGFNSKYKLIFCWGIVLLSLIFTISIFPITSIECKSEQKLCTAYKKENLFAPQKQLISIQINNIKTHAYKKFIVGGGKPNIVSYNPVFVMKDGEEIEIPFMTTKKSAEKIINNIMNYPDYKESFWMGKFSIGKLFI